MNRSKIEFCDYTWNPIVGCRIGCWYCYASKYHLRFFGTSGKFNDPVFYTQRLELPYRYKKPQKIFVCSMGDIFSPGIPPEWIRQVIKVAHDNPHHTFQFLTKRPEFYRRYNFPKNCWLGTTIDHSRSAWKIEVLNKCGCDYITFVLVEPLLSSMEGVDFRKIDFLFVGAMTGQEPVIPEPEWIASIKHHNIIWKDNIRKYLPK